MYVSRDGTCFSFSRVLLTVGAYSQLGKWCMYAWKQVALLLALYKFVVMTNCVLIVPSFLYNACAA
jgi:hypothetical protein